MNLVLLLALALSLGVSTAHAAPPRHARSAPLVATWFSILYAVSGGRET
jgi:hypothetical protein